MVSVGNNVQAARRRCPVTVFDDGFLRADCRPARNHAVGVPLREDAEDGESSSRLSTRPRKQTIGASSVVDVFLEWGFVGVHADDYQSVIPVFFGPGADKGGEIFRGPAAVKGGESSQLSSDRNGADGRPWETVRCA
jgi:hypothetical protein